MLLLVAKSGRVSLSRLARDLGWSRDRVYKALVWRTRTLTPLEVGQVLTLVGAQPNDLLAPVSLTHHQLADARRVFGVDA